MRPGVLDRESWLYCLSSSCRRRASSYPFSWLTIGSYCPPHKLGVADEADGVADAAFVSPFIF